MALIEEAYIKEVNKALDAEDFKLCITLLKRIELSNINNALLWSEVAFRGWKRREELVDLDVSFSNLVKEAFEALFKLGKPNEIPVHIYFRLAHIYTVEGSLSGALQIIMMASSNGYLVHTGVVLQRWLILKRLIADRNASMEVEIDECLNYLVSAISSESRDVGEDTGIIYPQGITDLPLYIIYLICAAYVFKYIKETYDAESHEKPMALRNPRIYADCVHAHAVFWFRFVDKC